MLFPKWVDKDQVHHLIVFKSRGKRTSVTAFCGFPLPRVRMTITNEPADAFEAGCPACFAEVKHLARFWGRNSVARDQQARDE